MKEKKSNDVLVFEKGEKEPPLLQYIKSNRGRNLSIEFICKGKTRSL